MSLKYVLNSMRRRKLRTFIIVMALTVGVALVGALLALVDTQRQFSLQSVGSQTGGYDVAITKSDLAASTFFSSTEVESIASDTYNAIAQMLPRIQASVEARKVGATDGESATFIAIDASKDSLIFAAQAASTDSGGIGIAGIHIGSTGGGPGGGGPPPSGGGAPPSGSPGGPPGSSSSSSSSSSVFYGNTGGTYPPESGQVYLDSKTAAALGVSIGDDILLSYAVPAQREAGTTAITTTSTPRITAQFTVAGISSLSGVSSSTSNPIIMRLEDAQAWLGQSGLVNQLLLVWQSNNSTTDARATVTQARNAGEQVRDTLQTKLGDEYTVSLPKYTQLESSSQSYTFTQTYIVLYGILSMSIIGLMVNALMTTTVAEQKYDLAVLRVLGSPRSRLYNIVILEVAILGVIGIVLGLLLGRLINDYLIVPIVLSNLSLPAGVHAEWTLEAVLIPTAITAAVLTLATLSPAHKAANTKVMVVLNPAAADQPTLDDLSKLRERRADTSLLIAGVVLLAFSGVILIVLPTVFTRGNFTGETVLNAGSLLLMVIGIALLFYFITTPLERVLVWLYRLIYPKAAYFAGRYALRGKGRNALISLMVVMSGVLPCLLSTQLALQEANAETDARFSNGAPLVAQTSSSSSGGFPIFRRFTRENVTLTDDDVSAVTEQPGIGNVVGVADNLSDITVSDLIKLRTAHISLLGVSDDLNKVLYTSLYRWAEGDATALTQIAADPNAAIISEGLSTALDLHKGDTLLAQGAGTDHTSMLTIVGVASRLPGFSSYFTRNSSDANNSGVLINLETYRELQNDPAKGAVDETADVFTKLLATTQTGVNQSQLLRALRTYLGSSNSMSVTATSEQVAESESSLQQSRVFIVLLTGLSMITAIFGVLAVMYTAVMSRRVEIGMLKAIGSSKGTLRGVFIGEAEITTLAAGIAGIIAGTLLGYAFVFSQRLQSDQPLMLAFDFSTAGMIIALVCVAALFSGALATQPVIRQKAITILRER